MTLPVTITRRRPASIHLTNSVDPIAAVETLCHIKSRAVQVWSAGAVEAFRKMSKELTEEPRCKRCFGI